MRRTRRRIGYRRRRVFRRRRTRISRNRFSFGTTKAFKLRNILTMNVVAVTIGTSTLYTVNAAITDLPQSGIYLWNQLKAAFEWYRVAAMKLTFIPSNTAMSNSTYQSVICWHDPNSTSYTISATDNELRAISYSNAKMFNLQRRWKYYRKMSKTLLVGSSTIGQTQDRRGFISCDNTSATQMIGLFAAGWPAPTGTPPTPSYPIYVGDLYVTYYTLFKGPRAAALSC